MSERNEERPSAPRSSTCTGCWWNIRPARTSAPTPPHANDTARLLGQGLGSLLREIHRGDIDEILTNLEMRIISGEAYAFYMGYLRKQCLAVITAEQRRRNQHEPLPDDGLQAGDAEPPDDPPDVRQLLAEDDRVKFLELYEKLLAGMEPIEREVLNAWVAAEGRRGWVKKVAQEMHRGQPPDRPSRPLAQIQARLYPLWYGVRDRIHECFGPWLQAAAEASGQEEARRALEDPDQVAGAVLPLIVAYCPPARPADGRAVAAPAEPKPPVQRLDPAQERLKWLRNQQRELMYDRARQCADRPLHAILKGWRDGKTGAALMHELYGAADPRAQERFDKDRDLLHAWYEQITREKRLTLDAWRFYDGMRHQGFRKFREKAAAHAEFRPIVEAAEKGAPYPELRERLRVRLGGAGGAGFGPARPLPAAPGRIEANPLMGA